MEPRCDLCRRRCLERWERWDGARVCAACIGQALDVADAVQRGRENTDRIWRHPQGRGQL